MRIQINGEVKEVAEGIDLLTLLEHLSLSQQRVAIELDREVIRRVDWAATAVKENAVIEIVHFVGGG
jgi:sulfur carrier protein